MSIKQFPFLSTKTWLSVHRVVVSLMLLAHGVMRISAGTVGGFGEFLDSKGFIVGTIIAWVITIFEICGGVLLAFGVYKVIVSIGFMIILIMGIILVHIKNGWFVVGHTTGGVEYSVLLIFSLLLIASVKKGSIS